MSVNRRKFFQLSFKTAFVIGAGNTLQSFAANSFTLPHKDEIALRFAVVSDGHYGQPGTKYEEMHNEMVDWLNAEHKKRSLNFTVVNGDLFHDNNEMLLPVKKLWDKLVMPYHVSHGNHDKVTEDVWQQTFSTKWHYAFEHDDIAFLVLNSADVTGKYIWPDLQWTKEQLEKYSAKKQLYVFMHITPFDWTKGGLPCPEIATMFSNQKNLKAVFHGHDHDQDNVKENGGKYFFFDSHVAGNWGTTYRGYRIVEVLKNGSVVTYQMNPTGNTQVNNNTLV